VHARMNRLEGPPERIDYMARRFEEVVVPLLRKLDGFEGAMVLADRSRGTNIAISYWDSEAAMHASEEAVSEPRKDAELAAEARSASVVEEFEVTVRV
jgi:heme-degrading monooxygenase HmoA